MDRLELIARSGTVGAGGAGFPTHAKLAAKVDTLIANAAECEPMLYGNQELIKAEASQVIAGLMAAADLVGAERILIAIKAKYKEAIAALEAALAAQGAGAHATTGTATSAGAPTSASGQRPAGAAPTAPASGGPQVTIAHLPDFYPAGDEHAIVLETTGRIVPENGLPLDVGVVVQNVETLYNLAAALTGRPVTTKWLTVTGAVTRPVTLKAPIGTPMSVLIAAAGGATVTDWAIVEGGPMMGRVVIDPATPITKTTGGLIILPKTHSLIARPLLDIRVEQRRAQTSCVRCRQCTDLCPRYLQGHDLRPHEVMQSLALFPTSDPVYDQAWLCSSCGLCEAFSCPMGLSPRRVMAQLKQEFGAAGRRYPKQPKQYAVRAGAEFRKVPGRRLLQRLGLESYYRPAPLAPLPLSVPAVTLLLKQHIGAPAVAQVKEGDRVQAGQLIAAIPDGKLGAAVHASISGVVTYAGTDRIRIEEATGHA